MKYGTTERAQRLLKDSRGAETSPQSASKSMAKRGQLLLPGWFRLSGHGVVFEGARRGRRKERGSPTGP